MDCTADIDCTPQMEADSSQQPETPQFNWKVFFEVEVDVKNAMLELEQLEAQVQAACVEPLNIARQGHWIEYALEYLQTHAKALRTRVGIQGQAFWMEVTRLVRLVEETKAVAVSVLARIEKLDSNVVTLDRRLVTVEKDLTVIKERLAALEHQNSLLARQNEVINRQNELIYAELMGLKRGLGVPGNGNGMQFGVAQLSAVAAPVLVFPTFDSCGLTALRAELFGPA